VRLAVGAIDHEIASVMQFVRHTLGAYPADHMLCVLARREHYQVARHAAHGPLHRAHDVATLAHRPQNLFGFGVDGPYTGCRLVRQPHTLQALQPSDQ
jgi:hypothetical protein